jgi:hypothetical protein
VLRVRRFFRTYEDAMTKKPTDKENTIKQNPAKPVASELQDNDLQQVAGGLAANHPAVAIDPTCVSKL